MDDPFDWELNYENLLSKSSSAKNSVTQRSHTTPVKDNKEIDKHKLDTKVQTQAPITVSLL